MHAYNGGVGGGLIVWPGIAVSGRIDLHIFPHDIAIIVQLQYTDDIIA